MYDGTVTSLQQLGPGGGYIAPASVSWYSQGQWDSELNASLGIQRNVGWNTVVDASWVATWGINQPWTININPIPLGADFQATKRGPDQAGIGVADNFRTHDLSGLGQSDQAGLGRVN